MSNSNPLAEALRTLLQVGSVNENGDYVIQTPEGGNGNDVPPAVASASAALAAHDAAAAESPKWTVFVVEKSRDHGTTFVTSVHEDDAETAAALALEETAEN